MPEQLLNLLKFFLLVLLYLFFLRVLRAVWTEVNVPRPAESGAGPPAPAPAARPRRPARPRAVPRLRVLEPAQLRGQTYELVDEVTLGRADGCQIALEDPYASQVHARVFPSDGQWYVEDLGSTNGTYLNRRRVSGPMVVQRRDRLQIGNTVLEMT